MSHLILGCVPSYTSYQDSLGALIVGNPLLSYLDVQLPGFLLNGLSNGKVRNQGLIRVKQGSLKPVRDDSVDTVFQGRALHIPVEALNLEAPFVKAPAPINPTARMVQRCTMALDHQFLAAQPIRSQGAPQSTLQQTTPSAPHQ